VGPNEAKSEPGTSQDIRQPVRREVESIRWSWLGNIRKVVAAPRGYEVKILPPGIAETALSTATPIRIATTRVLQRTEKMTLTSRTRIGRKKLLKN